MPAQIDLGFSVRVHIYVLRPEKIANLLPYIESVDTAMLIVGDGAGQTAQNCKILSVNLPLCV